MIVAPRCSSAKLAFSAAGFIATRTFGVSPGVRMSRAAKWIWNADTPPTVPAGARISAGKSGSVARSLPNTAVASVNRLPASCMPSPESPANRTMTRSRSSKVFTSSCSSSATFRLTLATSAAYPVGIHPFGGPRSSDLRQFELVLADRDDRRLPLARGDVERLPRTRGEVGHRDRAAAEDVREFLDGGRERLEHADRRGHLAERGVDVD